MSLEKRVEQLEQRAGSTEDFLLIVIASIGCDPEKMGPERIIEREVTGFSAAGRNREWRLEPGESVEQLKARLKADIQSEGHKAYAVCELYD